MTTGSLATDKEIDNIQGELGVQFPEDYTLFLKTYGDCNFFGVQIMGPKELYKFDEETLEMKGFIPFAQDSLGNFFAFDKTFAITKCSHDPFGYNRLTDTFTNWTKVHYDFIEKLAIGVEDWGHQYVKADKEIIESGKRMKKELKARQPKKWWEVWR